MSSLLKSTHLIKLLLTAITVFVCFYILFPKRTVWVSGEGFIFGRSATLGQCIGISQGITNKWLKEYRVRSGQPVTTLKRNDFCIGILSLSTLTTNINIDFSSVEKNQNFLPKIFTPLEDMGHQIISLLHFGLIISLFYLIKNWSTMVLIIFVCVICVFIYRLKKKAQKKKSL